MPDIARALTVVGPWVGLSLLALIFLVNALGILDQSVAVRELVATGAPVRLARALVVIGRLTQLVAAPCLFFNATRALAAIILSVFLIGATFTAHVFWKATATDRDRQLAGFLKNHAIIGGLLLAAVWKTG